MLAAAAVRSDTSTRRLAVRSIIDSTDVETQEDIRARLLARGFDVTQATISRDLDAVGAVRVKVNGHSMYRLSVGDDDDGSLAALRSVVDEFVQSIAISGNLIVLRVPPGVAHLVAARIDGAFVDGVLGTVAGDDTIMVIADEATGAAAVSARIEGTEER
ncbi:MAG: arginine repressor [Actinomycetota bacterium]|nr:arginine repressor [Actinomycetota bacterium]